MSVVEEDDGSPPSDSFLASVFGTLVCFRSSKPRSGSEGAKLNIGAPTDFKHGVSVKRDSSKGKLVGLPQAWAEYDPKGMSPRIASRTISFTFYSRNRGL